MKRVFDDSTRYQLLVAQPMNGTCKKPCRFSQASSFSIGMSERNSQDDSNSDQDYSDDEDKADEFVGGIVSSRANNSRIPRWRMRKITFIIFNDEDVPLPDFTGCATWMKDMLAVYHQVEIIESDRILNFMPQLFYSIHFNNVLTAVWIF